MRTGLAAGLLLAAAGLTLPAASQAQVWVGDVRGGRDSRDSRIGRFGFDDTYRIGYDRGFEDGLKRASKDRTRGDYRRLIHDKKYRQGDAGYKKSYGPRQDYIAGYRDGYEQAFRRGARLGDEARRRGRGRDGRWDPADRDDPYGYGRDDRWGRDRDDRWDRDDEDDWDGRRDRRDDDDFDDDVVYEEPPGRW